MKAKNIQIADQSLANKKLNSSRCNNKLQIKRRPKNLHQIKRYRVIMSKQKLIHKMEYLEGNLYRRPTLTRYKLKRTAISGFYHFFALITKN